jgi:hypothetical protein
MRRAEALEQIVIRMKRIYLQAQLRLRAAEHAPRRATANN